MLDLETKVNLFLGTNIIAAARCVFRAMKVGNEVVRVMISCYVVTDDNKERVTFVEVNTLTTVDSMRHYVDQSRFDEALC
jgi:hypothetical protein